jgi:NADPH:quinone reductase-like Zn-dependent oxidoreductase
VGEGVSGLAPGDRVAYACPPVGAYAERRNIAPDLLVRLPPDIADETAAAGLLKGVTASFLLHDVHAVRPGETVLVHAAAGGVGQLLVQWARHLGAIVVATVSSDEKAEIARSVGAAHVVVYTRENFAEAVARLTGGRGADVAYDAVGADSFARTLEALAPRGHLVSFGQASGPIPGIDIASFVQKSATVSRPNFGHYAATPGEVRSITDRLFRALADGVLQVKIAQAYPLREASEAHRMLESRRTTGSTILVP